MTLMCHSQTKTIPLIGSSILSLGIHLATMYIIVLLYNLEISAPEVIFFKLLVCCHTGLN